MQGICFLLTRYFYSVWYDRQVKEKVVSVRSYFLNTKNLLVPILIRYVFFLINFYFTVKLVMIAGWGLFPLILAAFATRDFVQASQLTKIYYHLKTIDRNNKDKD